VGIVFEPIKDTEVKTTLYQKIKITSITNL